ncbi:MAG: acyltransferase [Oceanococcus sp.]|nr:MAG: acyltransferase [Oceanococcus sp.]
MLSFLPAPILGVICSTLFVVNLLFWAMPVYVVIVLKLVPIKPWQRWMTAILHALCECWVWFNVAIERSIHNTEWEIRGVEGLRRDAQYLMISNHQSWNDIYVAMRAVGGKVPFFKFFIKQELIWVPVLGLVWWALDYPFMKRYSREQLKKRPELAGKDLETARKSCEKYIGVPVTVLNYLEGTRFTAQKAERQNTPYKHLLKPKSGGLAFAASALGPQVNTLIDMTIVYTDGAKGFWDLMCGRHRKIVVDVKIRTVPASWYAHNYQQEPEFRREAQRWVADLWTEKDALIERELDAA